MFGSEILDIAIGLVFVFFLLSIVASAANEVLAQIFSWRSANLKEGVAQLLEDPNLSSFAQLVYDHPLIRSFQGPGGEEDRNEPSYIQDTRFADALIDRVVARTTATGDAGKILADGIDALPDGRLKTQLVAVKRDAGEDYAKLRLGIAGWFDESMDRWSGFYKRKTQKFLFGIGLLLAIFLNVDAFAISTSLHDNPTARAVVVAQATAVTEDGSAQLPLGDALGQLEGIEVGIGWPAPQFCGPIDGEGCSNVHRIDNFAHRVVGHIPGWLVTALAVMLGAPFWFDTLSRLSSLRATGQKPKKTDPPADGD